RPSDLLALFKQTGPKTRTHVRSAEFLDNTVELIREMVYTHSMDKPDLTGTHTQDMETILQVTGCSSETLRPVCKSDCLSKRYRTITGHCNNRENPQWGAANTAYARWLSPEYEDPRGAPRGWNPQHTYHNHTLPPVRSVSQEVLYTHNENISLDMSLSHLLVEWGQWIDHDLTLTPQSPSTAAFKTGADCTRTCSRDTPCFPIQIPLSDPRTGTQSCMPFFRSAPSCTVPLGHREQLNAITAFVDASMVYGSSDGLSGALRNLSSPLGLLAVNQFHSDQGLSFMPFLTRTQMNLDPCGPREWIDPIPLSETPQRLNISMGNRSFCFQAGCRHFSEYFSDIIHCELTMHSQHTFPIQHNKYNKNTHRDTLYIYLSIYSVAKKLMHAHEGRCGIDPVLRGLLLSPAKLQTADQMMVEELTERLFQAQGGLPLDLAALNLQRGRDHGLQGYSAWRELCGLSTPVNESGLAGILGNGVLARKLLHLYGTAKNIDVWVGAISEPALPGGRVGPLLACLIAKQFEVLRDGDRFWWQNEGVFSSAQRDALRTTSLSRIICDNTNIRLVPFDPFAHTLHPDDLLPCAHIGHMNLSAWREPDTGISDRKSEHNQMILLFDNTYTHLIYYIYKI
uniref:Eosinophil peroxidase n=1 Tax=Cyprinus carpio TaxID=7962 RepID=A0A8C2KLX5_CYPCA